VHGSNGRVAWAAAAAEHDVNDIYLETIAPCPSSAGDCVAWTDPQGIAQHIRLQTFSEEIRIGSLGAITGTTQATYEVVPHHGPILPAIDRIRHALAPRSGASALSVRYTGYEPSFELRALYQLARAGTVHDAFMALRDIHYGAQSWTLIDNQEHIGWTTQAFVPVRKPAADAWDPLVRQDALAPFFVLPGDGSGDWIDGVALPPRYIPHAVDPPQGYLVTANADPVGATFDGLPLNQRANEGDLYAGVAYAAGLREDRITALVQDAAGAAGGVTLSDMAQIQHDTHSSVGARLTPAILAALDRISNPTGSPADLATYVASLSEADTLRLGSARDLLASWSFATPAATDAPDRDSAATALFNTWMHFFVARTLGDELAVIGFDLHRLDDNLVIRIIHAMLIDPKSFVTSPGTQQPILCDDYATPGPDTSCTVQILAAMLDAMTYLASPQGFATADTTAWRWGQLHQLTIAPLAPVAALELPAPGEAAGFPRDGDNFAINRADSGWADLDFSQRADGPAQRFLAEARRGQPIAIRWALPGGAIFDRRSPHYRDLLDHYYLTDQHFDVPIAIAEIVAAGESRWVFR
jgi:penicillin amidase